MNESLPPADDPVWHELPDGVLTIEDGDDVVGFAFSPDADVPVEEMNEFLARVGMPSLDDLSE